MPELRIEVVYALPERQVVKVLRLAPGATVADAIAASGLPGEFPQIDPHRDAVGVFGRVAELAQRLDDGDRVEIYRTLRADPKEARRARVRESRGGRAPKP
ncbi:RnfH family protein [Solimonas soli]|uniref:RnfH family protein n=1 Tax=Solimonas soli TaxID=413479 RepID=UPI000489D111|nr:RnfH family protein [Solimonas soli]